MAGYNFRHRRLLELGNFERRGGRWRFGAKRISDAIVNRLIAAGHAERRGELIVKAERGAAE